MKEIFINLKRFDVPRSKGGICPKENPKDWIEWVIDESMNNNLGTLEGVRVTYLLPEVLLIPAIEKLRTYPEASTKHIALGSQGVYRNDITVGGNFGAFTTNLPAAVVENLDLTWSIIGHSEERRDKQGIMETYARDYDVEQGAYAVNSLINEEVHCALKQNINVLLCVGETANERGEGTFLEQQPRIKKTLEMQLDVCLKDVKDTMKNQKIVIGYEPIWAIGPGKTPPGREYISFVSKCIKDHVRSTLGMDLSVVYGGGLKEDNAAMIASIDTIDGGLVALTKFIQPIAFEPEGLKNIISKYC